jgi:hypothetical protein
MKVDVIINVFGKPYQTLCTLKSLIKESGKHIDKIYLIEELVQPYNADIKSILPYFNNVIHYVPKRHVFMMPFDSDVSTQELRYDFRYQYGIENSDKKYAFITHNDILYTSDIIGEMLEQIEDCVGIGSIGQCWNCPAYYAKVCDGDKIFNFHPDYNEVVNLCNQFPPPRGIHFTSRITKELPMPMPECRLNEFACLIDIKTVNKECIPNGDVHLFGAYNLDLGDLWFREMVLKGHKFKNFNIDKCSKHTYFSTASGYPTQLDENLYKHSELNAKKYYEDVLQHN